MLYQLSYTRPLQNKGWEVDDAHLLILLCALLMLHPNSVLARWCRGQDSNLRRALARRVYSPVPLTARPPLHLFKCTVEPAKGLEPPTL